jgi:hypothetical protein
MRNKFLVRKPEGKRPLRGSVRRLADNIEMDLEHWIGFNCFMRGTCDHDNEFSDSI